jgi:predicted outer membrane protein
MKQKNNFSFLMAGLLAPGLLLLTMTPPVLAQMHGGGAPMGGSPNSNMNNNNMNNNMSPDGMQPNGPNAPQNNTQMIEHNTFGNLRRNFDVETDLSKMALKNSTNDNVKKFAQQVIAENHGMSNQLIVPNSNGEMLDPETVPSQTQKAKKQMKKMTGAPFDQMYLIQMDAYVKNDQQTARGAAAMVSLPNVSEVGTRVQSMSDDREKQIADLTKEAGFKIQ